VSARSLRPRDFDFCVMSYMMIRRTLFASLFALLAGCAGVQPLRFGSTIADVEALWGKPTVSHTLPSGARMLWSYGPAGNNVYVAEFDRNGRLIKQYDAMSFPVLARVQAGWKKWEVERELGPAFWMTRYRVSSNFTAVYKFESHEGRRCFYVEYDRQDVVVSTAMADEKRGRDLFPGEREC
jgi:hypothetical protein